MVDFRHLMNLWDEAADDMTKSHIKSILDGGDFVFFFKKGEDLYAANEGSRVIFATLKHPDEDTPKGWGKEANFMALDLTKALEGYSVKRMFSKKDLKDIEVVESEKMYQLLVKQADSQNAKINLSKVIKDMPIDSDDDEPTPANMDKLGEK